jgi:hypothetical protein
MGSKADGDPYIPMVIVRSMKLAKEQTYSMVEADDGLPMRVSLPKLRTAGRCCDAFVVATPNGGMNKELFSKYNASSGVPRRAMRLLYVPRRAMRLLVGRR